MFDNANVKSQKMLSPVAILGTGLHRQWLPPSCAGNKAPFASLENWELLLRELAETEGVAEVISPALLSEAPTLQWEELIRAGVTRNNNRKAAAEIEKRYRKRVVQLLSLFLIRKTSAYIREKMEFYGSPTARFGEPSRLS